MANLIYIPALNPVHFVELDPVVDPRYHSRFFDRSTFRETIEEWEQSVNFCPIFQQSDTIRMQIQSSYSPISLQLKDRYDRVITSVSFAQKQQSLNMPGLFIYEAFLSLAAIEEGHYYLLMQCGNPVDISFISEPINIKEVHENSILLEYQNYRFYNDVIFETGFTPSVRVLGSIKFKTPASKDTIYEDQVLNNTLLNSVPFRVWELVLSGSSGIPNYLIDKLNRILGCSSLSIDGRLFSKPEGAKLEEKALEDYPMRGWSIEMREKLNRSSNIYENESQVNRQHAIVINVDSKGFGADETGGNVHQIIDVI